MKLSPLEFAREFEKLKSDLARLPSSDLKLLRLVRFWGQLAPVAGKSTYESYTDDFRSVLISLVQMDALSDLSMASLKQIRNLLDDLIGLSGIDAAPTSLMIAAMAVTLRMVTLLFYVGEYSEAVSLCADISAIGEPDLPDPDELLGMSPLDRLREICKKVRPDNDALFNLLEPILVTWEENTSVVNHDRIYCLFIDKNGPDAAAMGRMRLLKGEVEQTVGKSKTSARVAHHSCRVAHHSWWVMQSHPKGRATNDTEMAGKRPGSVDSPDQVAFNNQIKTPDDLFIGVAYESLKAVRLGLRSAGFAKRAEGAYRAFLSIEQSDRIFTGDSIGLAAALLSFTQLLKPEVMRHDKFIASDIAVTGSINADGAITSVNDSTIAAKIKRAFFSHVRYVVVPESNAATARDALDSLQEQYPHRHLRLISVSHLNDVLDDRNIIRAEKVCPLDYIVRQTVRYTRATKVQVPLLLALGWMLLAILWPLNFNPLLDKNPQYVHLTERGFEALNKDSIRVWDIEYECDRLEKRSQSLVLDLNNDSLNEVAFIPRAFGSEICESNAQLFVYNNQGELQFQRDCDIPGEYVTGDDMACGVKPLEQIELGGESILITEVYRENPARLYLKFWDVNGEQLGWYINSGYGGAERECLSSDGDSTLYFLGVSNRMDCACFFAIKPFGSFGVGPPYEDSVYDLKGLKRGNQTHYVLIPRTDVNIAMYEEYNHASRIVRQSNGSFRIDIIETLGEEERGRSVVSYYLDSNLRAIDVSCDDRFGPLRNSMVDTGRLPQVSWPDYREKLRNAVTYWTDSGWVTEGDLRASGQ